MRLVERIALALAATLVPRALRDDWRREWRAELDGGRRAGRPLAGSVVGIWADALAVRRYGREIAAVRRARRRVALWEGVATGVFDEVRIAVRALWRSPLISLAVVATLAVAIGANTAVFSVVSGVALDPLPYDRPEELVRIREGGRDVPPGAVSLPNIEDWRARSRSFSEISGTYASVETLHTDDGPLRLPTAQVLDGFFRLLALPMAVGRPPSVEDHRPGRGSEVVLSHGLWSARFASDSSVVGRTVEIGTRRYTVVGVAPPALDHPEGTELWRPLALDPARFARRSAFVDVLARLRPEVSVAEADAEIRGIHEALAAEHPADNGGWHAEVRPLHDVAVAEIRPLLMMLWASALLVLVIACANVANLMLTRTTTRGPEYAVRASIGATRFRIGRHVLVEASCLGVAGAALGLVLASGLLGALVRALPADTPRLANIAIDGPVLLASAVATIGCVLAFSVGPAVAASRSLAGVRSGGGRTATHPGQKLQESLVVAETGLALALLLAAGLLTRSVRELGRVDLGFETSGLVTARLSLPPALYDDVEVVAFYAELLDELAALPGVTGVAAMESVPLLDVVDLAIVRREDEAEPAGSNSAPTAQTVTATEGLLQTLGLRLLDGRWLSSADGGGAEPVTVVSRSLALERFGRPDVAGRRIAFGAASEGGPWHRIVGVVHDVRLDDPRAPRRPQAYLAHRQIPVRSLAVVVRTAAEPAAALAALQERAGQLDPRLPVFDAGSMDDVVRSATGGPRLSAEVVGLFGALAALLCGVGLYGVVAFSVVRRFREVGIRVALGADRRDVLRHVGGRAAALVGAGIVLGLAAAVPLARGMAGLLYGVRPMDPASLGAATVLMIAVAAPAVAVPVSRALRFDPVEVLKEG